MENQKKKPQYSVFIVLMIGTFVALLNNTLINVAIPSIMKDLKIGPDTVQWLSTGFMLVSGILVPTTAFLIQKYAMRHLFLVAMFLFTLGAVVAGMAHAFPLLLSGRLLQAVGASVMMPLLMNFILTSFPVEKRGGVMGLLGLVMMGGPAIGPTLSGWIVEHYDWRWLFHIIIPFGVISFVIGFLFLKDQKEKNSLRLDLLSLILSTLGFGGILYGFSSAGSKGWDSPEVYVSLIVGVITLVGFILRQMKLEKPMLNFNVYKYPMFALSSAISMIVAIAMYSGMLLLPIYVQTLRGISPFDAGLIMLPGALLMAMLSPISGKLFDKVGGRILAVFGLIVMTVTTYLFSKISFDTTNSNIVILYALRCVGIAFITMPVMTNGLNHLPAKYYPHGTAMNSTLQQVSGAIGTSLLVTIMTNKTKSVATDLMTGMAKTGVSITPAMKQATLAKAMLEGIKYSFHVVIFVAAFALVLALFMKRKKNEEETNMVKEKEPTTA